MTTIRTTRKKCDNMKLDIQLLDSKGELIRSVTQWDINRAIRIQGLHLTTAPVIRLSNANLEEAISVQSTIQANIVEFVIPNELLQVAIDIRVCVCAVNNTEYMTISKFSIPVVKQTKPADYDELLEAAASENDTDTTEQTGNTQPDTQNDQNEEENLNG